MRSQFDAPIGYPSITANYTPDWRQWWFNQDNVRLYQFMGKDNVYFHTIFWPAIQLGDGRPWTMLHHISTTGTCKQTFTAAAGSIVDNSFDIFQSISTTKAANSPRAKTEASLVLRPRRQAYHPTSGGTTCSPLGQKLQMPCSLGRNSYAVFSFN